MYVWFFHFVLIHVIHSFHMKQDNGINIYGAVGNGILDVTEMDCTIKPNLCNPPRSPCLAVTGTLRNAPAEPAIVAICTVPSIPSKLYICIY